MEGHQHVLVKRECTGRAQEIKWINTQSRHEIKGGLAAFSAYDTTIITAAAATNSTLSLGFILLGHLPL